MITVENFIFQGLGRNFLRHLRRTRLLVHVVDAASEDPVADYRTVKEVCTSIKHCLLYDLLPTYVALKT